MDRTDFQQALIAIRTEYVETPRLKLTLGQMAGLVTLPIDVCKAAVVPVQCRSEENEWNKWPRAR